MKTWSVYLAGEIHTSWRQDLARAVREANLPIEFASPVTDHSASDDCGVNILGPEEQKFWHDRKGALLNSIRTRTLLREADIVVVRFGEEYRQWNAAFDAGMAVAYGIPVIVWHPEQYTHALKELDAAAQAVAETLEQIVGVLRYVTTQK